MQTRVHAATTAVRTAASGCDVLRPRPRIPNVAFSAVVLGATADGRPGGDLVDVYELDSRFGLIVVADISGKGPAAAAHAAFIRYTIRTLAIESDGDPASILAKFNAIAWRTIQDVETFFVLIVGIVDSQTGDVRYASAGHEPAYLRQRGGVRLLPPTGPIVGVSPFSAYRTETFTLGAGDVLVWATDGLTESRDAQRALLGPAGLADWIAAAPADAAGMTQELVARRAARSGIAPTDDVAVLAVTYAPETPASLLRVTLDGLLTAV